MTIWDGCGYCISVSIYVYIYIYICITVLRYLPYTNGIPTSRRGTASRLEWSVASSEAPIPGIENESLSEESGMAWVIFCDGCH